MLDVVPLARRPKFSRRFGWWGYFWRQKNFCQHFFHFFWCTTTSAILIIIIVILWLRGLSIVFIHGSRSMSLSIIVVILWFRDPNICTMKHLRFHIDKSINENQRTRESRWAKTTQEFRVKNDNYSKSIMSRSCGTSLFYFTF